MKLHRAISLAHSGRAPFDGVFQFKPPHIMAARRVIRWRLTGRTPD
jgi:hypothetical protein